MLSPADADIVRRDHRLRGLRTLLDDEAFSDTLRRIAPDHDIQSSRARYVRYKPGTSCLVAYEVMVGGHRVHVYARCHADDQLVKVSNARLRIEIPGPLGDGLLTDAPAGVAVFVYPNDYEIRALRKLFEGERTPRRLRRMLPAHPHLQHATPTVLRYKPERRFVGRLEAADGPSAVLRLYPEALFSDIREKAWAFKSNSALGVPRVVGDSERYSALSHEWVEGLPLLNGLATRGVAVLEQVAGALAALHRQRPRLRTMYSAGDYCRAMSGACDALSALDESLGRRAAEQMSAVRQLLTRRSWRPHAVHGDFTHDQVLVREDRVTVLDFDRAGYGDPVMDVGAFCGGLLSAALAGLMSIPRATEAAEAFVHAYQRESGGAGLSGVRACTAGSLLMTTPEPFRHRSELWPDATSTLLDCVDHVLAEEAIDA